MASRLELQAKLEELLGSRNVYYDPPANTVMSYPAIRYSRSRIENVSANNSVYSQKHAYELILIYDDPDSDLPDRIARLQTCRHDRHYVAENLHHDAFTLYF